MAQSKRTKTWYIVLYIKQTGMERKQTRVMGSMTPRAVGNTPTYAQTNKTKHTHTPKCVYASIQPPWQICRQTVVLTLIKILKKNKLHQQQRTVLVWPGKTLLRPCSYSCLLLCQKVPQSPFGLSACLSARYFCFVSQKCFISPSVWPLVFRSMFFNLSSQRLSAANSYSAVILAHSLLSSHLIHLTDRACSVNS